jgi:hypothetical protein
VLAVKILKLWLRPAIIVVLWVLLTAFTLSEIATITPFMQAGASSRPAIAP